jgi:Rrf2 family protein
MRVTRRADAAVRVMAALAAARQPRSGPALAAALRLPRPSLQQILVALRRAGLLRSRPGRAGGYRLARPAGRIRLLDIVRAVQGDTAPIACAGRDAGAACPESAGCRLRPVWVRVREATEAVLAGTSVQDLAAGP